MRRIHHTGAMTFAKTLALLALASSLLAGLGRLGSFTLRRAHH